MGTLLPNQRHDHYLIEAERAGIHQPILAALYQTHASPVLGDGETGLGVSPANRIPLEQVNTFPAQVQYGANVIRSLTESLIAQGWEGIDLWNAHHGCYTDKFLEYVAGGYAPTTSETTTARLEACEFDVLRQAYFADLETDGQSHKLPSNLAYLEQALITITQQIPNCYTGLPHQRDALLEMVRIWQKLDTRENAIAFLVPEEQLVAVGEDESLLDVPLKQFVRQISNNYWGYPYQRIALIRMTQLWRQLGSPAAAISSLETNTSPEENLSIIDPALIAFVQCLSSSYQGQGSQRNALTEAFRLWYQLGSRAAVLEKLGIAPEQLTAKTTDHQELLNLATQLDRELLKFVRRIPLEYQEIEQQRQALIRLVQLWRSLPTKNQTIATLLEDRKLLDAPRPPGNIIVPRRPENWTPSNIQLFAPIIPNGNFTWAEATRGGTQMPPNQATVDAIIRIAKLAQQARDRLGRPLIVISWYHPPDLNQVIGEVPHNRHSIGDAIAFICEGLTGNQIYWSLDPWWPGGLGRYQEFPYLSHIDGRSYRARWLK
ncbi:MAG: peptidase M15A [Symploca sp. SIO2E6]|nr:peptidase M15A [Symploca sp. SIO2E6]